MPPSISDHIQPFLDQLDRRQQALPLQAVRIQVVRVVVRRHHEHHAALEERSQKPAEDHRVGDVRYVKLVEADQAMTSRDLRADRGERIDRVRQRSQLVVNAFHERVKMNAGLAAQGHGRVKGVHQEALPASDTSPDVYAARRDGRIEPAPKERSARPHEHRELARQVLEPSRAPKAATGRARCGVGRVPAPDTRKPRRAPPWRGRDQRGRS